MVLDMLWDDVAVNMNWLDSVMAGGDPSESGNKRGPCDQADSKPETLCEAHPDSSYVATNVEWGDIGGPACGSPGLSPSPTPSPSRKGFGRIPPDCHRRSPPQALSFSSR